VVGALAALLLSAGLGSFGGLHAIASEASAQALVFASTSREVLRSFAASNGAVAYERLGMDVRTNAAEPRLDAERRGARELDASR
jgi:hypothetical protein